MSGRLISACCRLLDGLIAAMLAIMVVLVFGNVVLRYAFNSGISLSEELSRWLFVWLTFLGAVVALAERRHLGTDFVIARLPRRARQFCLGLSQLLMLFACVLVFHGAFAQMQINLGTTSAVMEAPVAWFYAAGVVFALLSGLILLRDFIRLLGGHCDEAEQQALPQSAERPHAGVAH